MTASSSTTDRSAAATLPPSTSATTCNFLLSSGFLLFGSESNATAAIVVPGAFGMTLHADATTSRLVSRAARRAFAMPAQRAIETTVASSQA
ncbi:hypothetical protein BC2230_11054 [Burkholderia cepacia]